MKFLVLIEGVPGNPLPAAQLLSLAKAQLAWAKRQKKSGKIEAIYGLAEHAGGLMGGMGICNFNSAEELAEALATMPAAYSASVKVFPLVGLETTERLIEAELGVMKRK